MFPTEFTNSNILFVLVVKDIMADSGKTSGNLKTIQEVLKARLLPYLRIWKTNLLVIGYDDAKKYLLSLSRRSTMIIIRKITDKDILGSDVISNSKPKISARAILLDDTSNIALMHVKKRKAYSIPGGGVELGEDLAGGLYREILEETGCKCMIVREIGGISENRARHDFTHDSYYYLAEVKGEKGLPQLTETEIQEKNEVVWFCFTDCMELIGRQKPVNYQFEFIKQRDLSVLNYLAAEYDPVCLEFRKRVGL